MYLSNKYTTWYYRIISNAQTRVLPKGIYTERHHIIPKSLGGGNSKSNLVDLIPKEHFVCHLLLTKMVVGQAKHKMAFALFGMSTPSKFQSWRDYKVTSKIYGYVRGLLSSAAVDDNPSKRPEIRELKRIQCITNNPAKGKSWVTNGETEVLVTIEELDICLNNGWRRGRVVNEGMRQAGSKGKGKIKSEITRQKMSGKFWWTDGNIEVKSLECPTGFLRGRLKIY